MGLLQSDCFTINVVNLMFKLLHIEPIACFQQSLVPLRYAWLILGIVSEYEVPLVCV